MKECPYYQGVCGLDESIICFTYCDKCDLYKDHENALREMIESTKVSTETANKSIIESFNFGAR